LIRRVSAKPPERADLSPVRFRDVLAVREFRALFTAHLLSVTGDELARLALALLVYARTSSAMLAALTFGLGYLVWVLGTPLGSLLADRWPRRRVMVGCDLARLVLVAAMAWPGVPLPVLLLLLAGTSLLTPAYWSARAALLPDVLPGDAYVVGSALSAVSLQAAQVVGFLAAGVVVASVGARPALALDALTFAVSAVLLLTRVRPRPAPAAHPDRPVGRLGDLFAGPRLVFGDRRLRYLVLLAWTVSAATVVPEALAVPVAADRSGSETVAGVLTAAGPFGAAVGITALARWARPAERVRLIVPLALLGCAPLMLTPVLPGWVSVAVLWTAAGLGSAYNLPANTTFVRAVPEHLRGRAVGLAQAGLQVSQGLAIAVAGLAARAVDADIVLALSGGLGGTAVLLLARRRPDLPLD
jgi:MFS family permease